MVKQSCRRRECAQCEIKMRLINSIRLQYLMKDSYVSNVQEILIANETQKNKIEFLERERIKRDHYLEDLQENLRLKNESLKEINSFGPNLTAINQLINQTQQLSNDLKRYYEEYQNLNALLLMEKQMRLEDKRFYNERMVEFQNKIIDLRKYLHDKEDSFSSVVARLKQYEDMGESSMEDKLSNYKKEIGERHINEFIAEILKEKSFYRREYQAIAQDYIVFFQAKKNLEATFPEMQDVLLNFEAENKDKIQELVNSFYKARQVVEQNEKIGKEGKEKKSLKIEPNKELIRLLKKEKLSKELHQQALNEAIEKNEELISIKQIYERTIQKLEKKCLLLYAENSIFALRLAEYDTHYCRYATHCKKYYEEGQIQGLRTITEDRLKEYSKKVHQYFESDIDLSKKFNQKLKEQVEKWGQFICDSPEVKRQLDRKGILRKSCSVPKLLVGFELDEMAQEDRMIIQQY